jgi:hypothetical protein
MARTRLLLEVRSIHCSLKECDPSAVSGRTKTPVSNFVQLTMNGLVEGTVRVGGLIRKVTLGDIPLTHK